MHYIRTIAIAALALLPAAFGATKEDKPARPSPNAPHLRKTKPVGPRKGRNVGPDKTEAVGPRKFNPPHPGSHNTTKPNKRELGKSNLAGCTPTGPIQTYDHGCPCFRLEDVTEEFNLPESEYCGHYSYDDEYGTGSDFYASFADFSSDKDTGGSISVGTYSYDGTYYDENDNEVTGLHYYCYAGVWYDDVTDPHDGVDVSVYLDIYKDGLTECEHALCEVEMLRLRDHLPGHCDVDSYYD